MALLTGSVLGAGYSLLLDDPPAKVKKKCPSSAIFTFRMYLGAPSTLRQIWLVSIL